MNVQLAGRCVPTDEPRVNPALLHGPHQAAIAVLPAIATAVNVWPAVGSV